MNWLAAERLASSFRWLSSTPSAQAVTGAGSAPGPATSASAHAASPPRVRRRAERGGGRPGRLAGRGWPVSSREATSSAAGPRSTGGDLSLNPGGHAQATRAGPLYSIFDPLRSEYLVYFGAATQCVQLTEARSPPYLPTRPPGHQPPR